MEYFFLLFSFFICEKRNFWLRQIKIFLVVLTLANTSCANRRRSDELMQQNSKRREPYNRHIDASCRTCGISNEGTYAKFIIDGTPVQPPYKYPWMVALVSSGSEFCGGAIISNNFILTAAHCVKEFEKQPGSIKIGFVTETQELAPIVSISAIYCHPKYIDNVFSPFDIALIRLQKKITCDKYKSPVCLPRGNDILPPSTHLTVAGWGANVGGPNPQYPDKLLQGALKTVSCERCSALSSASVSHCKKGLVYCMMGVLKQAACFGDSGGPMFGRINGKYYIQGVTSYGDFHCNLGKPFVFASASSSRSWIKEVAGI